MSGVSTERPHSRPILVTVTFGCFVLFAIGLTLALESFGVTPDRAFAFMAIMLVVYAISVVLAFKGGRFYVSSYRWRHWVALVIPVLLISRFTAFFDAGPEVVVTPGPVGFLYSLLDLTAIVLGVILAAVWMLGMRVARGIELLHPQTSEVPPSARSPEYYHWLTSQGRHINRSQVVAELAHYAVLGGVVLVACTAVNVGIGAIEADSGLVRAALTVMVLYFVSVLLLLSYTNLVRQTSQWSLELAALAPGVTGAWIRASLIILGIALAIALMLPVVDSSVFSQFGVWIVNTTFRVAQGVAFIGFGILAMFGWLVSLCRPAPSETPQEVPPEAGAEAGDGSATPFDMTELFGGMIVVVLAGLAAWYLYRILRQRIAVRSVATAATVQAGRAASWLAWALKVLLGFLFWTREVAVALKDEAVRFARRQSAATRGAIDLGSRREPGLSPRRRIHREYAHMVAGVARLGIPRPEGCTPAEFAVALRTRVADIEAIDSLTAVFVAARYALDDPSPDAPTWAAAYRARIQTALERPA